MIGSVKINGTPGVAGCELEIYDEKGSRTGFVFVGQNPGDGLVGYTSTTVTMKEGPFQVMYDEKGSRIRSL